VEVRMIRITDCGGCAICSTGACHAPLPRGVVVRGVSPTSRSANVPMTHLVKPGDHLRMRGPATRPPSWEGRMACARDPERGVAVGTCVAAKRPVGTRRRASPRLVRPEGAQGGTSVEDAARFCAEGFMVPLVVIVTHPLGVSTIAASSSGALGRATSQVGHPCPGLPGMTAQLKLISIGQPTLP